MKKYKFYFKGENGETFAEYIEASNYEKAVNIADSKENVEIDVDKTVIAFFRNQ